MVGPTPTPTDGTVKHGNAEYDPATYRKPYASTDSRWDYYQFDNITKTGNGDELVPTGPMAVWQGEKIPEPGDVDLFVRPDGLTPPTDRGASLPAPEPPPDAVIPLDPVLDVDVDEQYRPGTYVDGDLTVTYNLHITRGTWEDIGLDGIRVLTLNIDADIDVHDGYRLGYSPRDSGTAHADIGDQARSITEGAITTYELDPDTREHPDLV